MCVDAADATSDTECRDETSTGLAAKGRRQRPSADTRSLLDRRERGRKQDLRLLLEDGAVTRRRPDALGCSLLADGDAFIEALVGPDVHPLVEPADVGREDADQRRKLDAA